GVHTIAVGVIGIVVQPLLARIDHLLEEGLDVGQKRRLELVDEDRTGRVHRPQADQTLANLEPAREVHDPVRQVDEIDPLVGLDDERLTMDRQTADRRGRHGLDRRIANGDRRTLAHALLIACVRAPSSVRAEAQTDILREAQRAWQILGNQRRRPGRPPRRPYPAMLYSATQPTLAPPPREAGCKSHTVPPL